MKRPRVMPMGVVVVLTGALVSGGALAQPDWSVDLRA